MKATLALVRASWLTASSYRINMLMSIGALIFSVAPLYFVAQALQPLMADVIRGEGRQYFGFVVVGMAVYAFIPVAVRVLPAAIGGTMTSGTLEAVLGTPAGLPSVLAGLTGYEFLFTTVRSFLLVGTAALVGAEFAWGNVLPALFALALTVLAYVPIGLLGAALMLAFRTVGPLPRVAMLASTLLGGVYYPTHVIPSWLEGVSAFVPLTYGLRSLRRILLEGEPLSASASDLGILAGANVVLLALSAWALHSALRYARRSGMLSQY